ncbi:MAG TPA: hypothetical protein VKR38_13225 [Usitatibacter sp.]|nr:hypothetical protein [Usitatibacter sp.]
MKQVFLSLLLAAASSAQAAWTTAYEGENSVSLVAVPNSTGSNVRRGRVDVRQLPEGSYTQSIAPIVDSALQGCAMDDVRKVVMKAHGSSDLIGSTTTRLTGPGIYMNLPSADHVGGTGNWYFAPFYSIEVSLSGESGPLESFMLFEFERIVVPNENVTQEAMLKLKAEDLEVTIRDFAKRTMPAALRKALPRRCK